MRKPRAIIFDDEVPVLELLKTFLSRRDYEVLAFSEPRVCPIYENYALCCTNVGPCGDIMITDLRMPRMNGIELLDAQAQRGCKLDIRNKAVISGNIDDESRGRIRDLGCSFFPKPFRLTDISDWIHSCEPRMDLTQPLNPIEKRVHVRHPFHSTVEYCGEHGYAEVLKSLTINISRSGLCLYFFRDHREGERITIRSPLPVESRSATVRWIRRLQDSFWIAGLMFA